MFTEVVNFLKLLSRLPYTNLLLANTEATVERVVVPQGHFLVLAIFLSIHSLRMY